MAKRRRRRGRKHEAREERHEQVASSESGEGVTVFSDLPKEVWEDAVLEGVPGDKPLAVASSDLPDIPAFDKLRKELARQEQGGDEVEEAIPPLFGALGVSETEPEADDAVDLSAVAQADESGTTVEGNDSEVAESEPPGPATPLLEGIPGPDTEGHESDSLEQLAAGAEARWRDAPQDWESEAEAWKEITAEWKRIDEEEASAGAAADESTAPIPMPTPTEVGMEPAVASEVAASEVAATGSAEVGPETEAVDMAVVLSEGRDESDSKLQSGAAGLTRDIDEAEGGVVPSSVPREGETEGSDKSTRAQRRAAKRAARKEKRAAKKAMKAGFSSPLSETEAPLVPEVAAEGETGITPEPPPDELGLGSRLDVGSGEAELVKVIEASAESEGPHPRDEVIEIETTATVGASAAGGAEGGARAAGGAEGGAAKRNAGVAVITGVVFGLVALGSVIAGPGWLSVLAIVLVILAEIEFYTAVRKSGFQPAPIVALLGSILMLWGAATQGVTALLFGFFVTVVATILWYHFGIIRTSPVANMAITVLGVFYIALGAGAAVLTFGQPAVPHWRAIACFFVAVAIASDVGGYAVGAKFGRHPVATSISPKKSLEGYVGGAVLAMLVAAGFGVAGMFVQNSFAYWSLPRALVAGAVVAIAAPLGDLFESLIKRSLDVKDMGTILPGHGGVLDRVDSLLIVAPAFFAYLYFTS